MNMYISECHLTLKRVNKIRESVSVTRGGRQSVFNLNKSHVAHILLLVGSTNFI